MTPQERKFLINAFIKAALFYLLVVFIIYIIAK